MCKRLLMWINAYVIYLCVFRMNYMPSIYIDFNAFIACFASSCSDLADGTTLVSFSDMAPGFYTGIWVHWISGWGRATFIHKRVWNFGRVSLNHAFLFPFYLFNSICRTIDQNLLKKFRRLAKFYDV